MRRLLTLLAFAALCAPLAQAQVHSDQETKADIERHRAMAAAHTAAAQCLESGKDAQQCMKDCYTFWVQHAGLRATSSSTPA